MSKKYQLIVFDWDGTLMDSEARIVTCMQQAARDVGVPVPDDAAARDVIGLGLTEAVQSLFPAAGADGTDALIAAYRDHWLGNEIRPAALFAGARELVEALHRAGYLLAVATGKSRRGLDKVLEESGLGAFFLATRCADETFSKPHPQMLQEILTDLDTHPQAAVVVGDTEYDMLMARNAGVDALGVGHGVHATERLLAHGAITCFEDLFGLADWLLGPVLEHTAGA
jgi:phosphoglycolate phosphatase